MAEEKPVNVESIANSIQDGPSGVKVDQESLHQKKEKLGKDVSKCGPYEQHGRESCTCFGNCGGCVPDNNRSQFILHCA